ncbi:MAG: alcohol dehydrogenase [Candidatus Saganbacteria bacterium]|uniref:Alcohol dehydrogenase n=1 Tax=Candidatus Saganbacteria bacterium TaxID=2575572 RepID=A0A833L2F1_UNCSA|nr:MAG: alcohol dehydrogenase [Candidatus Saganbacteria bacterium]
MKDFSNENIRFVMKTEMLVGDGITKDLSKHLKANSWGKVGLVIDKGLFEKNQYVVKILEDLKSNLAEVVLFLNDMPEPTYEYLDTAAKTFRDADLDCFVAIGGGSTMDLSKGLAVLKTNKGKGLEYRGFNKVKNIPLPVVAIPSTAGTGSEVTPFAVFIDEVEKWKFGINTEYNYPRLGLYDQRLLDSCPLKIFSSAGMDAMTHTLESFVARNATHISRIFSREAFKLLFLNLKKVSEGDRSKETKLNLLIGSGLAGIALMNSGAGPAGALSYPLGVYFNVPHGLAGSVFLPEVIRFNVQNGYNEYEQLYDLAFPDSGLSIQEKSIKFAEAIETLSRELGIPTNLKGFGVQSEADLRLIIDNSMQLKAAFEQNPIPFGLKEIENTVRSLHGGE